MSRDANGVVFAKIPQLQFPVDDAGRTILVRDVTMYSKSAIFDAVKRWRQGGPPPSGRFDPSGAVRPAIGTGPVTNRQDEKVIGGINELATPTVFPGNVFGLQWSDPKSIAEGVGRFPIYFRDDGKQRIAVAAADVPAETGLSAKASPEPDRNPPPYSAEPLKGAWKRPDPSAVELATFDPALFVTPPKGLEAGYVPIVTWQGIRSP